MASIKLTRGGEEIARKLEELSQAGEAIGKMATYDGAKVIADGIRASINALPVDTPRHLRSGERFGVIVRQDKEDLANGLGIAQIRRDEDGVKTVIGFAGYGRHKTKKYKNGYPIAMLARSVESGSSVRQPHPFVQPAVKANSKAAKAEMIKTGNKAIQDMTKG